MEAGGKVETLARIVTKFSLLCAVLSTVGVKEHHTDIR